MFNKSITIHCKTPLFSVLFNQVRVLPLEDTHICKTFLSDCYFCSHGISIYFPLLILLMIIRLASFILDVSIESK